MSHANQRCCPPDNRLHRLGALRNNLNKCGSPSETITFLNQKGYTFNQVEFNDAVRMLHLCCQSEEEAAFLMGKAMWLRYVLNFKGE